MMDKPLIAVRREIHSTCHDTTSLNVYSEKEIKSYIIIDDFIATGRTLKHIMYCVGELMPHAKVSAIVLYYEMCPRTTWENIPLIKIPGDAM